MIELNDFKGIFFQFAWFSDSISVCSWEGNWEKYYMPDFSLIA